MGAEGVAQAGTRDPLVQDGEIDRVKGGVAQTRQRRYRKQARVAIDHGTHYTGHNKNAQGGKHQRPGTQAVHHKAG